MVSVGQEIGELLDLEAARVTIGLTDRQIVSVALGTPVVVTIEAYPQRVFEGTILRVGAAADEGSKKFPAEIEIDNADRRLLPGMVVRVELELSSEAPRLVIPREALVQEYGLGFVFVLSAESDGELRATRRRVSSRELPHDPTFVEISSGLQEGERVAVSGVRALRDGVRVRTRAVAIGGAVSRPGVGAEADAS